MSVCLCSMYIHWVISHLNMTMFTNHYTGLADQPCWTGFKEDTAVPKCYGIRSAILPCLIFNKQSCFPSTWLSDFNLIWDGMSISNDDVTQQQRCLHLLVLEWEPGTVSTLSFPMRHLSSKDSMLTHWWN